MAQKKKSASKKKATKKTPASKKTTSKAAKKKPVAKKKVATKKKVAVKKSSAKKIVARKAPAKKTTVKKASSKKKPVRKKAVTKKTTVKKKAVVKKKPMVKKAASTKKKTVARKAPAKKASTAGKKVEKTAKKKKPLMPLPMAPANLLQRDGGALPKRPTRRKALTKKELEDFKRLLQNLRDSVVDEISFLSGDNLIRSQRDSSGDLSSYSFHMADQGTDNFDREFALNLVSSEQDALYEIDEALERIKDGSYGCCQDCECLIEKERLKALPFARRCVSCKSVYERGKTKYRPFRDTPRRTAR